MGGIAKGIGNIVGSITGANQAADAQVSAANSSNENAWRIYQDQKQTLSPFLDAGKTALSGLQGLAGSTLDRGKALTDYFNSAEYQQLANQARYQGLTAAEATGGLGSTAMSNQLASIAPTLGQNYLNYLDQDQQRRYSQLLGLTNVGLTAGGATNAAAGNYASNYGNNMSQIGASNAGAYLASGNALTSGIGYLAGTQTVKNLGSSAVTGIGNWLSGLF